MEVFVLVVVDKIDYNMLLMISVSLYVIWSNVLIKYINDVCYIWKSVVE